MSSNTIQQRITNAQAILYVLECSVSDYSEGATPEIDNPTMAGLIHHARADLADLESLLEEGISAPEHAQQHHYK